MRYSHLQFLILHRVLMISHYVFHHDEPQVGLAYSLLPIVGQDI